MAPAFLQAADAAVAMLAEHETSLPVRGESIRAGFAAPGYGSRVTAGFEEDADAFALFPSVDRVARDVGEEHVAALQERGRTSGQRRLAGFDPHRSFGPRHPGGQLLQGGGGLDQSKELGIHYFE